MFRTVSLSIIRSYSLYTQRWYMSYGFCRQLSSSSSSRIRMFHPDPARKLSTILHDILSDCSWTVGITSELQYFSCYYLWTDRINKWLNSPVCCKKLPMFYAHYSSERTHLLLKDRFCETVTIFRLHTRQRTSENLKVGRFICLPSYLWMYLLIMFFYFSLGKFRCS
jgi:hypothetical protein